MIWELILELNRPMLINLKEVYGSGKLTLNTPKLQKVQLVSSSEPRSSRISRVAYEELNESKVSLHPIARRRFDPTCSYPAAEGDLFGWFK